MRIPGSERAYVDAAKVRDYLLAPEHPVGRFKARIFTALGYSREAWRQLHFDLQDVAARGDAARIEQTEFGERYEIRAVLRGPTARRAHSGRRGSSGRAKTSHASSPRFLSGDLVSLITEHV